MSRAPLSRGRPVSALFITVGAVLGAVYAASVPGSAQPEPATLTLVAPPSAAASAPVQAQPDKPVRFSR